MFHFKKEKQPITIRVEAIIEDHVTEVILNNSDIPEFKMMEMSSSLNFIDKFDLYYSIKEVDPIDSSLLAAISVDNRTVKVDLVADENKPLGYEMVFLLYSDYFKGKVDATRQNLTVSKQELKNIQTLLRNEVVSIIEATVPSIKKRNKETRNGLVNKYPHLSGYFDTGNIGYISRTEILKKAQDDFFKIQKELLDATSLTDEQFEKSIEVSSRALTEYILFRQMTIEKLKKSTSSNSEAELHKLFTSMRREI